MMGNHPQMAELCSYFFRSVNWCNLIIFSGQVSDFFQVKPIFPDVLLILDYFFSWGGVALDDSMADLANNIRISGFFFEILWDI